MTEQFVAIRLLEDVHSSMEELTLRHIAAIGGIKCRVLLPGRPTAEAVIGGEGLAPPCDKHHGQGSIWPIADWGDISDFSSATIRSVGLIAIQHFLVPRKHSFAAEPAMSYLPRRCPAQEIRS
jgi:hypothetical protein